MSNPTQVYHAEKEDTRAKVFALEEFKWAVEMLKRNERNERERAR